MERWCARPHCSRAPRRWSRRPPTGHPSTVRRADDLDSAMHRSTLDEADLPAQQPSQVTQARFPPAHGGSSRSQDPAVAACEGPSSPQCVIGRISRREDFARLHRHGTVTSAGPVRVRALVEPGVGVRVAFAARRRVGTAVRRNRLRRQAREMIRSMAGNGSVAEGWYLVSFGDASGNLTPEELRDALRRCLGGTA